MIAWIKKVFNISEGGFTQPEDTQPESPEEFTFKLGVTTRRFSNSKAVCFSMTCTAKKSGAMNRVSWVVANVKELFHSQFGYTPEAIDSILITFPKDQT